MPDGQIRLKGAVEPGVVAEVLQFLSGRTDRVGYLRVTNFRVDGRIWYQGGTIVSAECGPERDNAAIRRILCMKTGEFSFVDASNVPERTIFDDITTILLECFRQIDEAHESEPDAPEPAGAPTVDQLTRPVAPWAKQGSNSLSQTSPLRSAPATAPATKPAATSSAPRPPPARQTYQQSYTNQPRFNRRQKVLFAVALLALVISGLLFWWVDKEANQPGSFISPNESPDAQLTNTSDSKKKSFWHALLPARPKPPPPEPLPLAWPKIQLGGIVAVPGQKPSAIINGRLVLEGQPFEGFILETVTRTGIVLRSGERTLFVSEKTMGDRIESVVPTNTVAVITNEPPSFFAGFRNLMKKILD